MTSPSASQSACSQASSSVCASPHCWPSTKERARDHARLDFGNCHVAAGPRCRSRLLHPRYLFQDGARAPGETSMTAFEWLAIAAVALAAMVLTHYLYRTTVDKLRLDALQTYHWQVACIDREFAVLAGSPPKVVGTRCCTSNPAGLWIVRTDKCCTTGACAAGVLPGAAPGRWSRRLPLVDCWRCWKILRHLPTGFM